MIDLGQHAVFIIWAYIGVAIGIAALVAWTLLDARQVNRKLKALEARNPRRSD